MAGTRPEFTLRGRHAVVTGGGRGIGAAIARALASHGADVTVMGRGRVGIDQTTAALEAERSGRAQAIVCDVSDPISVASAFAAATGAFGPAHILVNNAGQSLGAAFQETSLDDWQRLLAVNLTGAFLCTQKALPAMIEAGDGRIINIASTAGLKGYAKTAAYCASKHGVVGLTRALAVEIASRGVTVNAVCPGYVDDTDMLRTAIENIVRSTKQSAEDARARLARLSPRGTLVTPGEVAETVLWLCSPGASAITGQAIAVAGGEVM